MVESFTPGTDILNNSNTTEMKQLPSQTRKQLTLQEQMLAARQKTNEIISESVWKSKVRARIVHNKLILSVPNVVLFKPGEASLRAKDIIILRRLARFLSVMPGEIRIEGHTSSKHIAATSHYHDAWSLSLARAASVLRVLEVEGVNHHRLSLAGYGPSKSASALNRTFAHNKNRRVDIILYQPQTAEKTPAIFSAFD